MLKNPFKPESTVTIQVVAVQDLQGRAHEHVRVFGYNVDDPKKTLHEVCLDPKDAADIIVAAGSQKEFPQIEVPDRSLIYVLNTGNIPVIRMIPSGPPKGEKPAS